MPQVIDQDGRALTWTAHYWRYGGRHEEECDSVEEAILFLESGEDYGSLSSESILDPDGKVVYSFGPDDIWNLARRVRNGELKTSAAPTADAAYDAALAASQDADDEVFHRAMRERQRGRDEA
jgi:hypothetical protein